MNTRAIIFMVLPLAFALGGCAEDYEIDFEQRTSPPGYASIDYHEIRIEAGIAVGVVANPVYDDGERLELETEVELLPQNPSVLGIERVEFDEEEEDDKPDTQQRGDWKFVIYGRAPGNTVVDYFIDGEREGEIPAYVDEPLAP
jgi:hypothetical protein